MRIGSDLDDVGYQFIDSYNRYLKLSGLDKKFKPGVACCWNFYECWGISREEFLTHIDKAAKAGIVYSGQAHDGFAESLRRIKNAGHSVHIVTARLSRYSSHTLRWLESTGAPYDSIHFTPDKTSVKTDMFVEDNIKNYDSLEAAGVEAYLINRPWNQEKDTRRRISGIIEFADIVLSKTI